MRSILPLASLLVAPTIAFAQTPPVPRTTTAPMATAQPACTAPAPLPAEYASFAHPVPAALGSGVFLGEAVTVDLGPGTHFAVPPGHVPAGGTFGGMVGFDVTDPGTYRVALGAGVWIDVVSGGTTAVRSIAHDHGPACSAVRKLVDFTLTPGHYLLQISGSTKTSVTFQVAKVG